MKTFKRILFLLVPFLLSLKAQAGGIEYVKAIKDSSLQSGAERLVTDPGFDSTDATGYSARVSLLYSRDGRSDLASASAWEYAVHYTISFLDTSSAVAKSFSDSLYISYNPEASTGPVYNQVHVFDKGVDKYGSFIIHVDSVAIVSGTPPDDIRLEAALIRKTSGELESEVPLLAYNAQNGEVCWSYIPEAEEFELEWVFIDSLAPDTSFINPEDPFQFQEPVRITTTAQHFDFSAAYPSGTVYFRVRGVGRYGGAYAHVLKKGDWSYGSGGQDAVLALQGFEDNKNWQAVTSFAEDGKYKKVVSYYDGSLRQRQTITNINSDETVIAAETQYDFEGRPALSVLPVPLDKQDLFYVEDLNTFALGKKAFDNNSASGALDATSTASQYYSGSNGLNGLHRDYLPDAEDYAYSLVQYRRDHTGRVLRQTSPGKAFRFDNSLSAEDRHFTRYFYATPSSTELTRLFGSNVGEARFYRKIAAVDPNGQISLSIQDNLGRVVATALAGDSTTNLLKLPSNPGSENLETITVSLNDNNTLDEKNQLSRSVNTILNLVPNQQYDFHYDIRGVVNHLGSEYGNLCADCIYELRIRIVDPNGTVVVDSSQTLSPGMGSGGCDSTGYSASAASLNDIAFAEVGEYKVLKELTLKSGELSLLASVVTDTTQNSNAPALQDFIDTYTAQIDSSSCDLSCDDHCRTKVLSEHPEYSGTTLDTAIAACIRTECGALIDAAIEDLAEAECSSYENQMLAQLSPGGHYNSLDGWLDTHRQNVTFADLAGNALNPQPSLADLQDPDVFLSHWADSLLPEHPEYCHLENCYSDKISSIYDKQMTRMADWDSAIANGYINPLAMSTAQGFPSAIDTDPDYNGPARDSIFFTGRASGLLSAFRDSLENYKSEIVDDVDYNGDTDKLDVFSLWTFVEITDLYNDTDTAPTAEEKWKMFRGLYAGEKRNVLLEASEEDTCGYLLFNDETIFVRGDLPTDEDSLFWLGNQWLKEDCYAGCQETPLVWISQLEIKCGLTDSSWQGTDKEDLLEDLKGYCMESCGFSNPFSFIKAADVGVNSYLVSADSIINIQAYNYCSLDSIVSYDVCTDSETQSMNLREINQAIYVYFDLIQDIIDYAADSCDTPESNCLSDYYNVSFDPELFETYRNNRNLFDTQFSAPHDGPLLRIKVSSFSYEDTLRGIIIGFNHYQSIYKNLGILNTLSHNGVPDPEKIVRIQNIYLDPENTLYYKFQIVLSDGSVIDYPSDRTLYYSPLNWYSIFSNTAVLTGTGNVTFCTETDSLFTYTFDPQAWRDSCLARLEDEARNFADIAFEEALNEYVSEALSLHANKCFDTPFDEDFYYTSEEPYQYHYTLYYYDQAGSLVQTVPPAGVEPLSVTGGPYQTGDFDATSQPDHRLKTTYRYNSLEQPEWQITPDGGATNFYYNSKGQLVLSQNARQKAASVADTNVYSYTRYDAQGRVVEVGELLDFEYDSTFLRNPANSETVLALLDDPDFLDWSAYTLTQITKTIYDKPYSGSAIAQENLRNRVSASVFMPDEQTTSTVTCYSYDFHGNVKELSQDLPELEPKQLAYSYDLLSGNVEQVSYQENGRDDFYHRYSYDADNRLTAVKTSKDGVIWDEDARYYYYLHGPLARVETGEDLVQGSDYYYTLQGWLKGINIPQEAERMGGSDSIDYMHADPGKDGILRSFNQFVGQDEFSMALGYYQDDFLPIGTGVDLKAGDPGDGWTGVLGETGKKGLYNGNIAFWATTTRSYGKLNGQSSNQYGTMGFAYQYDQLNRLRFALYQGHYTESSEYSIPHGNTISIDRDVSYTYDPNGNILTLRREGQYNDPFDNLTYNYNLDGNSKLLNNRLRSVSDAGHDLWDGDIKDGQSIDNYGYDEIGNLVSDIQDSIASIKWSVYGKVLEVIKSTNNQPDLEFAYDGAGNRILKKVKYKDSTGAYTSIDMTWYLRDASGNVMSVYQDYDDNLRLTEQYVYGSDRLGVYKPYENLDEDEDFQERVMAHQPGENEGIDANIEVSGGSPAYITNFGNSNQLSISKSKSQWFYQMYRSVLNFDLSILEDSSDILSAELYLYNQGTSQHNGTDNSLYVCRITEPWEEFVITGSNRPAYSTENRASIPHKTANAHATVDVTQLLKDMVAQPDSSYGFMMMLQDETLEIGDSEGQVYASSDHADPSLHPKLVITYKTGLFTRTMDLKEYELKDHLGNVRVTISDRKAGHNLGIQVKDKYEWGFESEEDTPVESWSSWSYSDTVSYSGNQSVYVTGFAHRLILDVQPGDMVSSEAMMKFTTGTKGGYIYLAFQDSSGQNEVGSNSYSSDPSAHENINEWSKISKTMAVPAGKYKLIAYLRVASGHSASWYDDWKVSVEHEGTEIVYNAQSTGYMDYFDSGMILRSYNGDKYRYGGAGGQEKDDEIYGEGNSYTAEFWQYDARLMRRWNRDIIVKHHESPYACFANNPIWFIDPFGSDTLKSKFTGKKNFMFILADNPDADRKWEVENDENWDYLIATDMKDIEGFLEQTYGKKGLKIEHFYFRSHSRYNSKYKEGGLDVHNGEGTEDAVLSAQSFKNYNPNATDPENQYVGTFEIIGNYLNDRSSIAFSACGLGWASLAGSYKWAEEFGRFIGKDMNIYTNIDHTTPYTKYVDNSIKIKIGSELTRSSNYKYGWLYSRYSPGQFGYKQIKTFQNLRLSTSGDIERIQQVTSTSGNVSQSIRP